MKMKSSRINDYNYDLVDDLITKNKNRIISC